MVPAADPGFGEGGQGGGGGGSDKYSAYIIQMCLLFNKSFFHKKMYGCVSV